MFVNQIPVILRGPARFPGIPGSGGGGKITFSDPCTGTNGNPPDPAIWTPDQAGWQYDGLGHYIFNGATYSAMRAACTPGDNILQADIDFGGALFPYCTLALRNFGGGYVALQYNGGFPRWEIFDSTGVIATGGVLGTGSSTYTISLASVGNAFTATFSGGANNGSFGATSADGLGSPTVEIQLNSTYPAFLWDNISLA